MRLHIVNRENNFCLRSKPVFEKQDQRNENKTMLRHKPLDIHHIRPNAMVDDHARLLKDESME